jgi:hypothetical protein
MAPCLHDSSRVHTALGGRPPRSISATSNEAVSFGSRNPAGNDRLTAVSAFIAKLGYNNLADAIYTLNEYLQVSIVPDKKSCPGEQLTRHANYVWLPMKH